MDKRQLTEIISDVYKTLTPKKVSVFPKNTDVVNVRVVSEAFNGMTFSARFKLLNQMLKDGHAEAFNQHIYVFEAFTVAEASQLSSHDGADQGGVANNLKQSARPLEP